MRSGNTGIAPCEVHTKALVSTAARWISSIGLRLNQPATKAAVKESPAPTVSATSTLGRFLIRNIPLRENIAAVHTAGQYQGIEIKLTQQQPAVVLHVETGNFQEVSQNEQLFVVDLQDIARLHRFEQKIAGVEVLAQVDIKNFQRIFGQRLKKACIVARDSGLRCASDPKHTALV